MAIQYINPKKAKPGMRLADFSAPVAKQGKPAQGPVRTPTAKPEPEKPAPKTAKKTNARADAAVKKMEPTSPSLAGAKVKRPGMGAASNQVEKINVGGKKLQSLRLDVEVIEGFKADGAGWQGRINDALRKHLGL